MIPTGNPNLAEVLALSAKMSEGCSFACSHHKMEHCKDCAEKCGAWATKVREILGKCEKI